MSGFSSWLRVSISGLTMVLVSAAFFVLMVPLLPWRVARIRCCNVYGTIAGKAMVWAAGAKVTFHHRDRVSEQTPAILLSNHSSTLDMWIGMWVCPMGGCGLAKREIRFVPGVGQLYLLSGHPMIDRSNRERAISTMNDVATFITANRLSLWLWPEGTRSRDGQLQPFKKGFVHAALATKLPIIPVVVHNAARVWPRGKLRFNPGPVDVEVLQSISTEGWSVENIDAQVDEVRSVFVERLAAGPPQVA
jgi:1-acyl-sn-glycerol-3-phosphate acyltransferase